jgi:subtilisin family serine protease
MVHDCVSWRVRIRRAVLVLTAAGLLSSYFGAAAVRAQIIMRSPNINVGSRIPSVSPALAPRLDANVAGRAVTVNGNRTTRVSAASLRTAASVRIGVKSLPYVRYSHNLYPACSYAARDSDGECRDNQSVDGKAKGKSSGSGRSAAQTTLNLRTIVAEIDGSLSDAQADELARRHGLVRLESQNFPLIGSTVGLFRVTDQRTSDAASRDFGNDASVRLSQPNFRYLLQDQKAASAEGDPAQYANVKLRLPEAHTLAHGANVTVAVIDSGIDLKHPELAGAIADSYDALGSKEGPHIHGTGVAGAIVAHGRLMGSAPAAWILAIRAFGAAPNGAQSTSYVILKALDYAAAHGAQIVNMRFAGPRDPVIERGIAAIAAKGIVLIAAAGNGGPKSPPLYPAANANVIAVSATDAQDRLFSASNRGSYVAIAAPGVDIFLPAPDEKYQMTSGTSFSAAYISGLAALVLECNPALKPDEVRAILMRTARDLGPPGRDDLFGAGEADAYAAALAAASKPDVPVAAVFGPPAAENVSNRPQDPVTRALNAPPAAMAAEKSDAGRVAAQ